MARVKLTCVAPTVIHRRSVAFADGLVDGLTSGARVPGIRYAAALLSLEQGKQCASKPRPAAGRLTLGRASTTMVSVSVAAGRSMAPAARVAFSGSAPVTNACSVDGKPLNTVDTSQA